MYRQVIDKFGLQSLVKQPNIPDFHLMVGSAENISPLPLIIVNTYKIPQQVINNMEELKEIDSETIANAIANNNLEVNDLNWNLALIGNGLGAGY